MTTHKVPNGWTLHEYDSVSAVHVGANFHVDGGSGRFTARFHRIPSSRTVEIYHFQGATPAERRKSLGAGSAIARGKVPVLPWNRKRMRNRKNWYFSVVLGTPINEAKEFERLRRGLLTDGAVELEFQALMDREVDRLIAKEPTRA